MPENVKVDKEGAKESETERRVREVWKIVHPSRWSLERMYLNTTGRFGHAQMFTALITGFVLFLTGFAGLAEHSTWGNWILMLGGIALPFGLEAYWLIGERRLGKKEQEVATAPCPKESDVRSPTGIWISLMVFALVIETILGASVYLGMITFGELVDYSFTFLLAIATILLAWFTKSLASVNERMRGIEENRDRKERLRARYERLREKIAVGERILTEARVAPVDGLRGQGSPPEPEATLMNSLRLLMDPSIDKIPLDQLDRIVEIFAKVKHDKKSDLTIAESIVNPYVDVTEALVSELPHWRQELLELIPELYS